MALDLGLGRRATPSITRLKTSAVERCHPNSCSINARRTFLVCYFLCMSVTMVLRRPILIRWTRFMQESVRILDTSPEALPSDKTLAQHIKMAHLAEKISVKFSMDDPSAEVSITDHKVVSALRDFEKDFQILRKQNEKLTAVDRKFNGFVRFLCLHWSSCTSNGGTRDQLVHP